MRNLSVGLEQDDSYPRCLSAARGYCWGLRRTGWEGRSRSQGSEMVRVGAFLGLPRGMESELLCPCPKAASRHSHSRCQHLLGGSIENSSGGTSLVVQGLRIHLQETGVRSLVGELRSQTLQGSWAHALRLLSPSAMPRGSTCYNQDLTQPNE